MAALNTEQDYNDAIDTIISEAVGGGAEGMQAVAWVIANRAREQDKSVGDIVRAPSQFTGYSNPGSGTLAARQDKATRLQAARALREAVAQSTPDPTGGSTHFLANGTTTNWSRQMSNAGTIGDNTFYRPTTVASASAAPEPAGAPSRAVDANSAVDAIAQLANDHVAGSTAPVLSYANQNAQRNLPVSSDLENAITSRLVELYGPGYTAQIMSGGQGDESNGIVGTRRHTTGAAGDIWVNDPQGTRLTADALLPLAQSWLVDNVGSVGFPANNQSLHLDLLGGAGAGASPLQSGEGRLWFYGDPTDSQRSSLASAYSGVGPSIEAPVPAPTVNRNISPFPNVSGGAVATAAPPRFIPPEPIPEPTGLARQFATVDTPPTDYSVDIDKLLDFARETGKLTGLSASLPNSMIRDTARGTIGDMLPEGATFDPQTGSLSVQNRGLLTNPPVDPDTGQPFDIAGMISRGVATPTNSGSSETFPLPLARPSQAPSGSSPGVLADMFTTAQSGIPLQRQEQAIVRAKAREAKDTPYKSAAPKPTSAAAGVNASVVGNDIGRGATTAQLTSFRAPAPKPARSAYASSGVDTSSLAGIMKASGFGREQVSGVASGGVTAATPGLPTAPKFDAVLPPPQTYRAPRVAAPAPTPKPQTLAELYQPIYQGLRSSDASRDQGNDAVRQAAAAVASGSMSRKAALSQLYSGAFA